MDNYTFATYCGLLLSLLFYVLAREANIKWTVRYRNSPSGINMLRLCIWPTILHLALFPLLEPKTWRYTVVAINALVAVFMLVRVYTLFRRLSCPSCGSGCFYSRVQQAHYCVSCRLAFD